MTAVHDDDSDHHHHGHDVVINISILTLNVAQWKYKFCISVVKKAKFTILH